jgi:transcriptional regulator with XRE-family HTH domain
MSTETAPTLGRVPEWTLGNRLWRARLHLGVTQQELAERLGVGLRQVKDGEADRRAPKRAVVLGWAVATGVDPYWLETGIDPRGGPNIGADTIRYLPVCVVPRQLVNAS